MKSRRIFRTFAPGAEYRVPSGRGGVGRGPGEWALVCVLLLASAASASPIYNIVPLGFDDLEHTRNDGYKYSFAVGLNEAGQVRGASQRYNGGSADLGWSVWLYNGTSTIGIGLVGSEHTRNNGYKYSEIISSPYLSPGLNEAGQVIGYSRRYNGGSTDLGQTAWLYGGATTIPIGLTGPEHTHSSGYKYSVVYSIVDYIDFKPLNEAGQVVGTSSRYNGGSTLLGQSAWLYDGATTIDIGLVGSEHTGSDGRKSSYANQLNNSGQVSGYSNRYNGGSADLGQSAWLYNGATTINVGLTGPEHTHSSGYKYSGGSQLNEAGQVSGRSYRYNGSTYLGQSAWLYDGATTINIGLTGSEHTRNDGFKSSVTQQVNEAGQVLGYSQRYNGSTYLGESAWLYDGATTINIGLTGSEHTHSSGLKSSVAWGMNEAGQVRGYSLRYNGSTDLGATTWLYDGATTTAIGLTSPEHTGNDGITNSYAQQLNEAGQVIGNSTRYNGGSTLLGYSVWFYNGTTTIEIGLTGPEYTANNGYEYSSNIELNEAGQVRGVSYRYNGGSTQLGQDAWFYDLLLDQTISLQVSMRSDGYAFSSAAYLGEDGLVLGTYTLFDALDNDLGNRAFYFTVGDGLHDLGSLVDGGLPANGWDYLASAIRANGLGQILGHGDLTSQSGGQMAYLLTPVPEPNSLLLAALGILGMVIGSWRRLK